MLDWTSELRFICLLGVQGSLFLAALSAAFQTQSIHSHIDLHCMVYFTIVLVIAVCKAKPSRLKTTPSTATQNDNDGRYKSLSSLPTQPLHRHLHVDSLNLLWKTANISH
jgi:hypothetical protein